MISWLRIVVVAGLAGMSLSGLSLAQESMIWNAKTSGSFVTLSYGPLDPQKNPVFMLSCLNGMGIAVLTLRPDLGDTKIGAPLTIEVTGGGATASVEGEAARDETTGTTYAEASDIKIKPIVEVLRTNGPITVKAGDATLELADHNLAQSVDQFTKDCALD